jgi:MFS family permease
MMADSIEHVISYWIIYEKFKSPALAGFAVIAHWLPFLLFSVWSGALADRFDPRRLIQLGMLLFMSVSFAWGVLFLTDTLEMWHAGALLVVHGLAGVLWMPAAQLFIHELVDDSLLHSAIRLTATARWLGLLFGPAVGGVILLVLGPAWGILFNVLIYLPLILYLWKAPYRRKHAVAPGIRGYREIFLVIKNISSNPVIISMTLLVGAASLIVGNAYQAQMPEFAVHLGQPDGGIAYSALLGADAAGALTAGLLLESRGLLAAKPRSALVLAVLWCLAMGSFALANNYALALVILFVAGFVELAFYAMAQTLVQVHAPAAMRGRVIGVFAMASLGTRAFSGVTVGLGGSLIGIHWSLALSAAALFLFIMILLFRNLRSFP